MSAYKVLNELIKKSLEQKNAMHLYLFRHGQSMGDHTGSVVGWTDSKLSIKGRQQSNKMFRSFHGHVDSFTSIHSSDLSRCKQSLKLSLGFPERKVIQSPDLRQLNFGNDQGVHYDSLPAEDKKIMSSLGYKAPNGQSWTQARQRATGYFSKLSSGHHLISTHGGLICSLTYSLGIKQVLPNCSLIGVQFCPINKDLIKINFQWRFPDAN